MFLLGFLCGMAVAFWSVIFVQNEQRLRRAREELKRLEAENEAIGNRRLPAPRL